MQYTGIYTQNLRHTLDGYIYPEILLQLPSNYTEYYFNTVTLQPYTIQNAIEDASCIKESIIPPDFSAPSP